MKTQQKFTHQPYPYDSRCCWFQAVIPEDLNVDHLDKINIKFSYFKKGEDIELEVGTLLINSEARHHRTFRGHAVKIGLVTEEEILWIFPGKLEKKFIKDKGFKELMLGSGDLTAVLRVALYLRKQEDIIQSFKELKSI